MTVTLVTGTGTDVGKTIVAAAIATNAKSLGKTVAVVKPVQTGVSPNEPGDVHDISRLVGGVTCVELARYVDPLAPRTAARRAGVDAPTVAQIAKSVVELDATHDEVLLEGAGGLLVQFNEDGATIADVAIEVSRYGIKVQAVVVVAPNLGTLNTTALTMEALRSRGLACKGIVIGRWPKTPGLAEDCNLQDLPIVANAPLLGVLPNGIAKNSSKFGEFANAHLAPSLGGTFGRL